MDDNHELEPRNYIEDPDALVRLCQSVINELLASINAAELREKQAQLIEVSRSIDQLTKLSIGIPDELRNLKISLVTEIEIQTQSREKLEKISVGLKETVKLIDSAHFTDPPKKKRTRRRRPKSDLPHTKKEVFRSEIIDALKILGGSGTNKEVIDIIEERMKEKLLPGDFEERARGALVWKNNVHWERNSMREEGILRSDSPRGTWELSEEYK
jgi:hypothetical protein